MGKADGGCPLKRLRRSDLRIYRHSVLILYSDAMPELPEVETTVRGLRHHILGQKITKVWTSYNSQYFKGSETIKDPRYFKFFTKNVTCAKIVSVIRRAKNILIELDNDWTILVHMKMTGHFLYGQYKFNSKNIKDPWEPIAPDSLKDNYNRHIRLMFSLSNKKFLAFSDLRKFAKVTLIETPLLERSIHLNEIGPEPLEDAFTFEIFKKQLVKRPNSKIKSVLLDQSVVAGIGNIYADESLWLSSIHPLRTVTEISEPQLKILYKSIRSVLNKSITTGGSSTSDYRNVNGEKGCSHEKLRAYKRTGEKCEKKGCKGIIKRIVVGTRGTHFCSKHQK